MTVIFSMMNWKSVFLLDFFLCGKTEWMLTATTIIFMFISFQFHIHIARAVRLSPVQDHSQHWKVEFQSVQFPFGEFKSFTSLVFSHSIRVGVDWISVCVKLIFEWLKFMTQNEINDRRQMMVGSCRCRRVFTLPFSTSFTSFFISFFDEWGRNPLGFVSFVLIGERSESKRHKKKVKWKSLALVGWPNVTVWSNRVNRSILLFFAPTQWTKPLK